MKAKEKIAWSIAEKVMKWIPKTLTPSGVMFWSDGERHAAWSDFSPMTNTTHAMQVAKKFYEDGFDGKKFAFEMKGSKRDGWYVKIAELNSGIVVGEALAAKLETAICLAALEAVAIMEAPKKDTDQLLQR